MILYAINYITKPINVYCLVFTSAPKWLWIRQDHVGPVKKGTEMFVNLWSNRFSRAVILKRILYNSKVEKNLSCIYLFITTKLSFYLHKFLS